MTATNKVMALPAEIRSQLDQKLRAANYGDLVGLAAWLTDVAYPVSKSGLHRYAQGLKATDVARGADDAQLLVAIRNTGTRAEGRTIAGRKAFLLVRLAQLELERAKVLQELGPLMIGDESMRDDPTTTGLAELAAG